MKRSFYLPEKIPKKTNPSDPVEWYYKPLFGYGYKKRLALALDALGTNYNKLLEVGYGSGILLPELSRHCQELHAIDIHNNITPVQEMLECENVRACLKVGSILDLKYTTNTFDAVMSLSVLEFIDKNHLPIALKEIHRVTKSGGRIVLGFPRYSKLSDLVFRLYGLRADDLYSCSYHDMVAAVKNEFPDAEIYLWPSIPNTMAIYAICRCQA